MIVTVFSCYRLWALVYLDRCYKSNSACSFETYSIHSTESRGKMYSFLFSFIYTFVYFTMLAFCTVLPRRNNIMDIVGQHGSISVDPEQIPDLLQQNANQLHSTDSSNSSDNQCQVCRIRENQKKLRIMSIKSRISHALQLDVLGLPNVTRKTIPKVPSYERLRQQYELNLREMQSDQPYSDSEELEDEEEEFGRMERTFIFSEDPPASLGVEAPNAVYFNLPNMENRHVYQAHVWIYITPRRLYNLPKNVSEMFLYKMVDPGKQPGPPVKRFMKKRKKHIPETHGWHNFDITDLVNSWVSNPSSNLGIVLEAFDANNENLIVLSRGSTNSSGYEPNLEIKTTTTIQNHREKRSTTINCDEQNQFDTCCRYPLTVDFVDFGWDFVIAPRSYDAYYCAGECRNEGLSESGHSAVVQHVPESRIIGSNPGPCCTPVRMANLEMLYFDHSQQVQLTMLPRMRVVRCGCA